MKTDVNDFSIEENQKKVSKQHENVRLAKKYPSKDKCTNVG